MGKKRVIILFIISALCIIVSCIHKEDKSLIVDEVMPKQEISKKTDKPKEETENKEIKIIEDDNKIKSKLDGLRYSEDDLNKRPIAVMYDNHPSSRWQAGISEAEIIYECEVEFPYTRYLAIFLTKEPEQVGGVRSARPYCIYYALEYDPIYVHCGGSPEAFSTIENLLVADIDGLYSGAFWRYYYTGKLAPNNLYTSLKKIRNSADLYGYRKLGEFEGYKFYDDTSNLSSHYNAELAGYLKIKYNKENTTEYIYDEEKEVYIRKKDGELHIDENNSEQITAKNILIIEAIERKVLDSKGRLYLGTIGKGNGYYITNGEIIKVNWEKPGAKDRTVFYDEKGEEISLNPGKTWIQVISSTSKLTVEEKINE